MPALPYRPLAPHSPAHAAKPDGTVTQPSQRPFHNHLPRVRRMLRLCAALASPAGSPRHTGAPGPLPTSTPCRAEIHPTDHLPVIPTRPAISPPLRPPENSIPPAPSADRRQSNRAFASASDAKTLNSLFGNLHRPISGGYGAATSLPQAGGRSASNSGFAGLDAGWRASGVNHQSSSLPQPSPGGGGTWLRHSGWPLGQDRRIWKW